tara:strand:+ start:346 stop:480 length:135 start_codon:yes stop_codon:yes gene_type:complete
MYIPSSFKALAVSTGLAVSRKILVKKILVKKIQKKIKKYYYIFG